jgi:aminopeptidase-like protein
VADDNESFFGRIANELPLTIHRFPSGETYNGWVVQENWRVVKALIRHEGRVVFDGKCHVLAVASYSKSFEGELDFEDLKQHVVTDAGRPEAVVYHCMWQYRPWDADWAFCMPYRIFETLKPGRYEVELVTQYESGEMLVGTCEHRGRTDQTIVFNAHTCHPHMANDDLAGVAILIRLFQSLQGRDTYYSYRLVLGPEHIGTVFYLKDLKRAELESFVGGAFAEMPGTPSPIKLTSTFLGNQGIDRALRHAARHVATDHEFVPWREGAGNDETVWEAPGYEVPFVEVSRCADQFAPYPEYHTNLDTPDILDCSQLDEFYRVLEQAVDILEHNARLYRTFDGLICLSSPEYDLYLEREDPAIDKNLDSQTEKWGHLLDSLLRYFDGSVTLLDIADKHDLPFDQLYAYLQKFEEKGLLRMEFEPVSRPLISTRGDV